MDGLVGADLLAVELRLNCKLHDNVVPVSFQASCVVLVRYHAMYM